VLDSYFNFTNKSNLINSLKYDLMRFFDHLGVAYFFGATLYILTLLKWICVTVRKVGCKTRALQCHPHACVYTWTTIVGQFLHGVKRKSKDVKA